jgi:hypothetical protein
MESDKNEPASPSKQSPDNKQKSSKTPDSMTSIALEAIGRIKYQPFLFIIAIVALVIGLVLQATSLGSSNLRFLILVIAILTFITILGFYFIEALKILRSRQPQIEGKPVPTKVEQPDLKMTMQADGKGSTIEEGTQAVDSAAGKNVNMEMTAKQGGKLIKPIQKIGGDGKPHDL